MPELPDVTVYLEALERHVVGRELLAVRLFSPFVLRSVEPPLETVAGRKVIGTGRIGKRIVMTLQGGLALVIHLMIAGRLRWRKPGAKPPGKMGLVAFDFAEGTLMFTEAGSKKRASLHLVLQDDLGQFDRGGLEIAECDEADFLARLRLENRTLKRALTDQRLFSGIGNAYSDEILHRAHLSPLSRTRSLNDEALAGLFRATVAVLQEWTDSIRQEAGDGFPEATAFREGMAVHGRYGQPCHECRTTVRRIRYAENETNYCPRCQTDGRLLADRSLSRILKRDWPRSIDELE